MDQLDGKAGLDVGEVDRLKTQIKWIKFVDSWIITRTNSVSSENQMNFVLTTFTHNHILDN